MNTDPSDPQTFAGAFGLVILILIALYLFSGGKDDRK